MRRVFIITLVAIAMVTTVYAQGPGGSKWRRHMTRQIDERERNVLPRNTRPEAKRSENDQGALPDSFELAHMQLLLKRSPEAEAALTQRIAALHDPNSPYFRKWLSAKELRDSFGPAESDIDAVSDWLTSHGFTLNNVQTSGMVIDFSGNAGQISNAFKTRMHRLKVRGEMHLANMSDPSIPSALASVVSGVVSLHDFRPRTQSTPQPLYTYTNLGKTSYAVVPADIATIYNMNPLFANGISGQGQTIVLIENSNVYNLNDWMTFRSALGLASYTDGSLTQIHPSPSVGVNNCIDPGVGAPGYELEATLDAQWASAAAPSADIVLASCKDTTTTFGGLIALQNILNSDNPPNIISISFGECETSNGAAANAAFSAAYQQAVAMGTSVFVASGDSGGAACDFGQSAATRGITVNGLASTPYNVAVGGTDFSDTFTHTNSTYWSASNDANFGSALSYVPEIPWNSTCASTLLSLHKGYSSNYGSNSFCNSVFSQSMSLAAGASGGGPSGCATGSSNQGNIVGGTCAGYAKPAWQAVLNNPNDGVRDLPDVSLFAGNGAFSHYYVTCDSNPSVNGSGCSGAPSTWSGAGGTSYTAPIWAGFQALINQYTGTLHGNPNPVYYSLAAQQFGSTGGGDCDATRGNSVASACIFYDVTVGDTVVPCTGSVNCFVPSGTYGILSQSGTASSASFNATNGWDFATGLGSVNVTNLVEAFYARSQNPTITSASSAHFAAGNSAAFSVTTSGFPPSAPLSITLTGALPSGVQLLDNHDGTATLSGSPLSGTGGSYALQLKASNGISEASQSFLLAVDEAPQFTSGTNVVVAVGKVAAFTIRAAGSPAPSITAGATLPQGLTLVDNGNGTATLGGIPAANTQGTYTVALSATNGVSPSSSQNLSITIQQAPAITSAAAATALVGQALNFTVSASGFPNPSFTVTPALPIGLTLADHNDGTATISGTPAQSTTGTYSLSLVASNGVNPSAAQNFTLVVNQTPVFTTSSTTSFTVGNAATFVVATSGYPKSTISLLSPLPSGLTFKDIGNGTATLSGTPAQGTQGAYVLTFSANNGVAASVTQAFTLALKQAPSIISSAAALFDVGTPGLFIVRTSGFPIASLSTSSSLPSGLTFRDNGDGTATLSGTAAISTQGIYVVSIVASNGVSSNASQGLSVTIRAQTSDPVGGNEPPPASGDSNTTSSGCDALQGGKTHADWFTFALLLSLMITLRRRQRRRN